MMLHHSIRRLILLSAFISASACAAGGSLIFGVNEGTSSNLDAIFRQDKYAGLAAYLGKATGKTVRPETSNILPNLIRSLKSRRYDVLLVRPSHISARAMRDQGYKLLVAAKGDSKVHFIVRADSPMKSLRDVQGKFIVFPDELAYPTALGEAILRDHKIDPKAGRMQYMNRQEAVGYAVNERLADVGVVISYSKVAKNWQKDGGRFLHTRDQLPYWSIIHSPNMPPDTVEKLRQAFLDLDKSRQGKEILKKIGIEGFVPGSQQDYLAMLEWVEDKTPHVVAKGL